ncbi:MAG: hypothetical protein ACK5GN_12640 [Pseudomonadota bacterium]|jgi:hypothetical protein
MLPKRVPYPTPDETMEEVNNTTEAGTERTSEPHIVVACPSCNTKFAVESSLVASYEVPRFHCSRCDSIFELSQEQPKSAPQTTNPTQRWVLDDTTPKKPHNDDASVTTPAVKAPLKSTDFTLGTTMNPDTFGPSSPAEPVEQSAGLSILGFRPRASRRHSSSLTRSEAQSFATNTQKAPPVGRASSDYTDPFALFDAPGSTAAVTTPEKPATAPVTSSRTTLQSAPVARSLNSTVNTPTQPPVRKEASPTSSSTSIDYSLTPNEPTGPANEIRPGLLSRFSDKTQNLVRLSIPVAASVVALCLVTFASRLMPLTMDSVFGAVVPGFIAGRTAHLPPAELSVQDLNLQLEKTQSKETIPVIRGFVSNASDKTFEDVSIEALGFNARGELLVRARAPLRSALSREKISDLPLETVKKFQTALSASDASIKAGEKVAFSVALFLQDTAPQEVTYFSARVFSVGRER